MKNFNIKEACEIIGISRSMLYKLIKENRAPKIIRIGDKPLIPNDALHAWLKTL